MNRHGFAAVTKLRRELRLLTPSREMPARRALIAFAADVHLALDHIERHTLERRGARSAKK